MALMITPIGSLSAVPSLALPAAEPAPEAPADQVSVAPPRAPWARLAALGLMSPSEGANGAVGAVLTASVREGLLAVLERLDGAGVVLEYRNRLGIPWLRKKHVKLTPAEALDRIERSRPDLEALEERLEEAAQVYRRILQPALARYPESWVDPSTLLSTRGKFPLAVEAAVSAELLRAPQGWDMPDYQVLEAVGRVFAELREGASTPYDLARRALLVVPGLRRGEQQALEILRETSRALESRAADPSDRERLEELFFRLLQATGSASAALEGVDLVRIAVSGESEEERVRLFEGIARRESEASLPQTAEHYRAALVHRPPRENLLATGARFVRLLEGMAVGRHQDRAAEVFAVIQGGLLEGRYGPDEADALVERFLNHLVVRNSVDEALGVRIGRDG